MPYVRRCSRDPSPTAIASIWSSRENMRPSSSPSDPATGALFGGVLARGRVAVEVGDAAWLAALLDAEAALAVVSARAGLIPHAAATSIAKACAQREAFDVEALGRAAAEPGNPVLPLVRAVQAAVPPDTARHVHHGATSQDILDTAMMLVSQRAGALLLEDLRGSADAAARLATAHRDDVMVGRTLLQHAVPTTFGLQAAGWARGLDGAAGRLAVVAASLPAQLGGAVGTLAAFAEEAAADAPISLVADFAHELGLREPVLAWHTMRLPVADLAGALGTASGVIGKVALDVILLAQNEVGEVVEGVPGRGASSTMPHKSNPVAAVSARASALRAPGLVSTLLWSMAQEQQRAAGAWHAEWETLTQLLRSTGSAAAWLRDCLEHLIVDPARMLANLGETAQRAGAAGALVDRAIAARDRT
jgi:3-carboxy-cis,cis-muconate cycloisomerase